VDIFSHSIGSMTMSISIWQLYLSMLAFSAARVAVGFLAESIAYAAPCSFVG